MKYIGIIPARYKSSRFPGKPLCNILGKLMIERTHESVMKWDKWDYVCVATDDSRIEDACKSLDIPVIMTSESHTDCLDRAEEAAAIIRNRFSWFDDADRFVVIQGDEPFFNVDTLDVDLSPEIVNFYTEVHLKSETYDPNAVKVTVSKGGRAIYFSRYSVPYHEKRTKRTNDGPVIYKQVGVYSFSYKGLKTYSNLEPSSLENMEGIGLLRLLENDIEVYMRYTKHDSISIDTIDDKIRIEELIGGVHQ